MTALRIPSTSLQYIKVGPVRLVEDGKVVDVTESVVELAFTAVTSTDDGTQDPAPSAWTVGSWETGPDRRYMARVLQGTGGAITLAEGTYNAWLRLTRDPERPVIMVDNQVIIT